MKYELLPLVKATRVFGLIGFNLQTRLGCECLGVCDVQMGGDVRKAYREACRTLRLRQQGFDLETAKEYSKQASQQPAIGKLAILHMGAEKEGYDFFQFALRSGAFNKKVQ